MCFLRYKRCRRESEDRLSNLPICLRTKILSRLPIKDAAKTSVLSKEWKQSWTFVTKLKFNAQIVKESQNDCRFREEKTEALTSFLDRALLLRERSFLKKFHLSGYKWSTPLHPPVNDWINSVLLCNVEQISLSFRLGHYLTLDSSIFLCKTLVILILDINADLNIPTCVFLPCLKTLHLYHVKIQDDRSIPSLLSGCPVLEELDLFQCMDTHVSVVNINAPSLKSLAIFSLHSWMESSRKSYEIVLDTPALQDLDIWVEDIKAYTEVKKLNNLMKAKIDLGYQIWEEDYEEFLEDRVKAMINLLYGTSQVQRLNFSWEPSEETIQWCDAMFPIFSNLTYMEFFTSGLLLKLLEYSPRLHTLHLEQNTDFVAAGKRIAFNYVPTCFLSSLKVIQIEDFRGLDNEMQMVEYFLWNAKVLEKLTITYKHSHKTKKKFSVSMKKLQVLPRSSATCELQVFHGSNALPSH